MVQKSWNTRGKQEASTCWDGSGERVWKQDWKTIRETMGVSSDYCEIKILRLLY